MTENIQSIKANGEQNIENIARNVGSSMREKPKSKHKFGESKALKAEEVRKYFLNPKTENEVFG